MNVHKKFCSFLILLITMPLGLCATLNEYTIPTVSYVWGNSTYVPNSEELKNAIKKTVCSSAVVDCVVNFGNEYQDSQSLGWGYSFTYSYTLVETPPHSNIPEGPFTQYGTLSFQCPLFGFWTPYPVRGSHNLCTRPYNQQPDCEVCSTRTPNQALPPALGDPIFPSTLVAQEQITDYENASKTLRFVRTYQSDQGKWTNNYQQAVLNLSLVEAPNGGCFYDAPTETCYPYGTPTAGTNDIAIYRGNSRMHYFNSASQFSTSSDINDKISPLISNNTIIGWTVKNGETDAIETYDGSGHILSSKATNSQTTTFSYSDNNTPTTIASVPWLLIKVTDAFGSQLNFTYDPDNNLSTMTDPSGAIYKYTYGTYKNLTSVTYPDEKIITYVYAEPANAPSTMPSALTGIIDENGNRYATITYNSNLVASGSSLAGGVDKYSFSMDYSTQTSVIDPLGHTAHYNFTDNISGVKKFTGVTQTLPTGMSVHSTINHDVNGNVTSITDFNGNNTTYSYDLNRNLQLTCVEATGTQQVRTITTQWHPTLTLKTGIAEPKRLTIYTYDANGNVLTKTIQATTDANGSSGFNAAVTGTARVWTYTYNQFGQVLTAKGPRTDVNDLTSYTYDDQGNLNTITDAVNHVTTLSNYDLNGRVGTITDPNGLVTTLTYTPRGWLASRTIGDQNTNYTYDGVGQLTQVTLSDNSTITYTYDAAHRLTNIADSLGNSIAYTLDVMGNRTTEMVNDLNGVLARKTTRIYDSLNQLKTQTGLK